MQRRHTETTPARRGQVVVLGMHRSGTSATTALLNACGAHVGGPEEIKAPSRVNPRGFFERWDVRAVCDGLLRAAGADWWKVSRFDPGRIDRSVWLDLGARAEAVVAGLDRHGLWAMKDPRLCLALPLFRERLSPQAVSVVVVRHPVEVAQSLHRRDGFPIAAGLALWEAYMTAALRNCAGMPKVLVRYGELVDDPAGAGRKLIAGLRSAGLDSLRDVEAGEVLDPSLRHHRAGSEGGAEPMTSAQRELWRCLSEARRPEDADLRLSDAARRVLEAFETGVLPRHEPRRELG